MGRTTTRTARTARTTADATPAAPVEQAPAADATPTEQAPAADATPTGDAPSTVTVPDKAALAAMVAKLSAGLANPAPADAVAADLVTMYPNADAAGKARIRAAVDTAAKDAIRDTMAGKHTPERGMALAAYWQRTGDALSAAKPSAPAVDYAALVVDRIAALHHAIRILTEHVTTGAYAPAAPADLPDGFRMDAADLAKRLADAQASLATDAGAHVRKAAYTMTEAKLAAKRSGGKQNDVGAVVLAAFDGIPVGGTLTVSQIITRAAANGHPDVNGSWNGRITARLVGGEKGCTIPGIAHVRIGDAQTHGAVKQA